jgi:hypothetical protein
MAITDTSGTGETEQLRRQLEAEHREKAEILIENGRLRTELVERETQLAIEARTAALREAELNAVAEVLQLIVTAPGDVDRVLSTIAQRVAELFGAYAVLVDRVRAGMRAGMGFYVPGEERGGISRGDQAPVATGMTMGAARWAVR